MRRTPMANPWFESVAEAQRRAKKRLPKGVYGALVAGSERGLTLEDNLAAFAELGFAPHTAGLANERNMGVTVMGQPVSMPVLISPTGVQAVHPDGEVAVARAAAARGVAMGLSSFASKPIEEVVAANPQTFFQMYWVGTREEMLARMERAKKAGAVGLIATLDWSFAYGRDWGSPFIPEKIDFEAVRRYAPQRSEEHTSELQSRQYLVCRLLLDKKIERVGQERDVMLQREAGVDHPLAVLEDADREHDRVRYEAEHGEEGERCHDDEARAHPDSW